MTGASSAITHVSDTSLLIAGCRAVEAGRRNALVRDPFAGRLAGDRGIAMFRDLPHPEIMGFGIAVRTRFIDELVCGVAASGAIATVASVGAGLDTRPWRLDLPRDLRWIEVDFAPVLEYKERLLANEPLRCRRERLPVDVNDPAQRARLYSAVGEGPALMLTEGLLMYLPGQTVRALASEAPRESGIAHWLTDVVTTSFTEAIGGGGARVVRHVQADDHLAGEAILQTLHAARWRTAACRSYIRDLDFAAARMQEMAAGPATPPKPPPFDPADPSGVHLLVARIGPAADWSLNSRLMNRDEDSKTSTERRAS